jgi:hypothetical protein
MDPITLQRISATEWRIEPHDAMRVPAVIFADEQLIADMDEKVREQITNVAGLPGIVEAAYALPDAHWGYGFPIGGVAAFDAEEQGVICAGGVGFDISCGVRTLLTGLTRADLAPVRTALADSLFREVPAGVGSKGKLALDPPAMEAMLTGGARWAVELGYGTPEDLERIEEQGRIAGALPDAVSERARTRQRQEMGTLGSGNHYLEVQEVVDIADASAAAAFGLRQGEIVVSIHCGSRGLGHQVATDYQREMAIAMPAQGSRYPTSTWPAPQSFPISASAISAPCAQRSTVRWPTGRSSPTLPGACSAISSRKRGSSCCSTFCTISARRRATSWPEGAGVCSCIAKVPRGRSVQDTPSCRRRCNNPGNPSSSVAAWAPSRRSWPVAPVWRSVHSPPPATAPDAR